MKKMMAGIMTVSAVILAACGNSQAPTNNAASKDSSNSSSSSSLVVSTFGLSQDKVEEVVMKPFGTTNSATVTLEVGNASERLTKLKSGADAGIDIIELSQTNADQGVSEGLFDQVTVDQVPNIANLTDGAKEVYEAGLGVPYAVNSIGIVYDKEAIGRDLTSWDDLWSSDLAGKVAIPDISTTFGPAMLYIASDHQGVAIESDKGEAAFAGLKALAPNIVKTYSKSSDLANMFQSGEISVAVVADFAYDVVKGAKSDVVYMVPQSGTYANYNTINVPKNSKNKDLAYKYIDFRISADLEKQTAASFNEAPVNKTAELSDKVAENKTYGEVAKRAKNVNTHFVNQQMKEWLAKWNEVLNQ